MSRDEMLAKLAWAWVGVKGPASGAPPEPGSSLYIKASRALDAIESLLRAEALRDATQSPTMCQLCAQTLRVLAQRLSPVEPLPALPASPPVKPTCETCSVAIGYGYSRCSTCNPGRNREASTTDNRLTPGAPKGK